MIDMKNTGADLLASTLADTGVTTCFANPGTTEMHLVAAFGRESRIATHLCLFEGVATGAADGFGRMAGRPAVTLLHLGPGLANGVANLHNARKAATPVINIVGEHATDHVANNAPLASDIEGIAGPVSDIVVTADSADGIGDLAAELVARTGGREGRIATLCVPNDVAWTQTNANAKPFAEEPKTRSFDQNQLESAVSALRRGSGSALIIGSPFISERAARLTQAIALETGCTVLAEAAVARMRRGGGLPLLERIPFHVDAAVTRLASVETAVLAGARDPVAFFAYPGRPRRLLPEAADVLTLGEAGTNLEEALSAIAVTMGVEPGPPYRVLQPELPEPGPLTPESLARVVAHLLPQEAIVVDESITSGAHLYPMCADSASHDWLNNRGGSIGFSLPVAVGCAVACPSRRVIALTGDGSAFYTLQALWTMARSKLDVTVVILANGSYQILRNEMEKIGAGSPDEASLPLITLDDPAPDWIALARGHGVAAGRARTTEEFAALLRESLETKGPRLIEAVL